VKHPHHHLGIDQIFGAAERDEADPGARFSRGLGRGCRRRLFENVRGSHRLLL
jgi:hypothetical protein